MKLDSKYFDMIRIRPRGEAAAEPRRKHPPCQWKGCAADAPHRAPKGRGRDGEYYMFCADHVREYNASYNYFDGMSAAQVEDFQKSAVYGHRPTWKVGANAWSHGTRHGATNPATGATEPPANTSSQAFHAWRARQAREDAQEARRRLKPLERKALDTLGVREGAAKDEIKVRFKELVKRHHPDLNEGDRGSEDTLREIIQAYNYLKQAGLV
jgi:hypothetical protein